MSLEINIRKNSSYKDISIEADNTTIQLGLYAPDECVDLALTLIRAAEELLEK